MKKIIYSLFVIASAFFATSCQQENLEQFANSNTVTYTVQVPDVITTRATSDDRVDHLIYEVYREADIADLTKLPIYEGTAVINESGTAELVMEFVRNQKFIVLFWAQNSNVTAYTTTNLREVSLAQTLKANDFTTEVFSGIDTVDDCVSSNKGNVRLNRPIAQINIATSVDGLVVGDSAKGSSTAVTLDQSELTVEGLFTTFNVYDKNVSGEADFSYLKAAVPAGEFKTDYRYVVMSYVGFADKAGTNVDVKFNIYTSEGKIQHTVNNVPVKPNYRTNILGNLITGTAGYAVSIDNNWVTPDNNIEAVAVSNAADLQDAINNIPDGSTGNIQLEGDIYLGTLAGMISTKSSTPSYGLLIPATKTLILDLNGCTLSQEVGCTASYSMIENRGHLTIIDSKSEGKISFNDSGAGDPQFGWGSYTISNQGTLVVNSGTIEHTGKQNTQDNVAHMYCAIQQNNDKAILTVNGGTVSNQTYRSIRINSGKADIKGGNMIGQVWVHPFADNINLNIEGGNFQPTGADGSSVFVTNNEKSVTFSVTGGFFATKISCSVPANLAGTVTGGTFTESAKANTPDALYAGYYFVQDGENYVLEQCPVKIGETAYATLAAAVGAVQEGETITILTGKTLEEGTVKLPAALKNVTIMGEEGATLKDMTIMSHDGSSISYEGLTFNGITFDNSRISITGWRTGGVTVNNFAVTNCSFENLYDTTNSAPLHFNMAATEPVNGLTFTNNVIDGATGGSKSGIYAQVTGNVLVSGNVINNVSFRPYVIQVTTDDNVADNFVVTNNTFSGSAVGRAQGLGNNAEGTDAVNIVVTENIFKGITDAQQICYWNFNSAKTTADLSHNYYDIDILANPGKIYYNSAAANVYDLLDMGVFPIYTDAAKTTLYTPEVNSAKIGETEYATLQEAVAAAKAGDTITVLCKVDYSEELVLPESSSLEIKADANIKALKATNGATIIIEDGKTLTLNNFSFGSSNNSDAVYEINGGTVTANYGFFQHGTYELRSNFETGYMYYSFGSDITVYGTFHSKGLGDGLDYVRGNLTIAKGGKSIHEKSLWVGQPASWGPMEASLTIEDGGYVQANNLCVYEGSSLTYYNNADLKYNKKTFEGTITAPQPDNEIWYTATALVHAHFYKDKFGEGTDLESNVWDETTGKGVITLSGPVTKIGSSAFYQNAGDPCHLTSITLPNTVTEIGEDAFDKCINLTTVKFSENLVTIGSGAFGGCEKLTNVTLPEGLTTIADAAFQSCEAMASITIPASVTSIGASAFNLERRDFKVYCKPTTPPTVGYQPFNKWWAEIYVPAASLTAYQEAWGSVCDNIYAE